MPIFEVEVDTLDRRSSFGIDWEADSAAIILQALRSDCGVDVLEDDGSLEFYPFAGIRKITIRERSGG